MKTSGSGPPGHTQREWVIRLSVAVMASLIAAILGPFATYENFSFSGRLLYWGGMIMGLVLPGFLLRTIIYRFLSGSPLKQDILAACILSVIIGPAVWAFNIYGMGLEVGTPWLLAEHIAIVLMVCLVPVAFRAYLRMTLGEIQAREAPLASTSNEVALPQAEGQAAFMRRLDPCKRGNVWRVSADDHQLLVCTDQGDSRLRLRFSDALEELAELDGIRIHRSHWVARGSIEAVVPDGRRLTVRLQCGAELPVSQNRVGALRDAGFVVD